MSAHMPVLVCAILVLAALPAAHSSVAYHVASDGDDADPGTAAKPFATLEGARDAIRNLKQAEGLPTGGVVVEIGAGTYERSSSFELSADDSGADGSPIVYRAAPGAEVRISGGRVIPADAFAAVTSEQALARIDEVARGKVLQADLTALGITELGNVPVKFRGAATMAELFLDDKRMTLARWPDGEWAVVKRVVERGSVPRTGDTGTKPGVFEYDGDRPSRWAKARELWLNGYWCFDWYDETIKVKSVDPEKRQITFATPHLYGVDKRPNRRWYAVNLLEELTSPGEYYIDRESGLLYFRPPSELSRARIVVSSLQAPIVQLRGASHVTLQGLIFETTQGTAVAVSGGEDVQVLACTVRNTGQGGISISGGKSHWVEACEIHDTGTIALGLGGGDRRTLTPAAHQAINNHIHHFGRRQRTYASGIHISGVGNRAAHNLLHDAPHQAIGLSGNDHILEFNEVHHVTLETDDCGAFYMGRNPSCRGNVIRHNFWHHLGAPLGHGNNAVYFDDGDGGQWVYGNVFLRCGEPGRSSMGAMFCHGGHDNMIENNVFIECKRAIGASPWNDKRWKAMVFIECKRAIGASPWNDKRWKAMVDGDLWQTRLLKEVDITKPPYTTRYPQLIGFMDPKPRERRVNRAVGNVAVMCAAFMRGNYTDEANFVTDEDPGFVAPDDGNFALREGSIVFEKIPGFQPIPFDQIGLQESELRPELPERRWDYEPIKPLPKTEQKATRAPVAKTGPPPVFRVNRAEADIVADGQISPEEWPLGDAKQTMVLAREYRGYEASPTSAEDRGALGCQRRDRDCGEEHGAEQGRGDHRATRIPGWATGGGA